MPRKYLSTVASLFLLASQIEMYAGQENQIQTLKLKDSLKSLCTAKPVQRKIAALDPKELSMEQRAERVELRRQALRHELSKDLVDAALRTAKSNLEHLSIDPTFPLQEGFYRPKSNIKSYIPKNCDYLERTEPEFWQKVKGERSKMIKLQAAFAKTHDLFYGSRDPKKSGQYFMTIANAYELVFLNKFDKLFHSKELRGKLPKLKILTPPIYPVDPGKGVYGYARRREAEISFQSPILFKTPKPWNSFDDGPNGVGGLFRNLAGSSLYIDIFDNYFLEKRYLYGTKNFFSKNKKLEKSFAECKKVHHGKENPDLEGFQRALKFFGDAALSGTTRVENGFCKSLKFTAAKYVEARKGSDHFRQLVKDVKPYIKKNIKFLEGYKTNVAFYKFLDSHGFLLDGEEEETFGEVNSAITPAQRRYIAAFQIFLKHQYQQMVVKKADEVLKKKGILEAVRRDILRTAQISMGDVKGTLAKVCRAKTTDELKFVEEQPALISTHLMAHNDKSETKEYAAKLDGFCNAGMYVDVPIKHKNYDKFNWAQKKLSDFNSWAVKKRFKLYRRSLKENCFAGHKPIMKHIPAFVDSMTADKWGMTCGRKVGGWLETAGGAIVVGGSFVPLHPKAEVAKAIGKGLAVTGSVISGTGSAVKAYAVHQRLMVESHLVNPATVKAFHKNFGVISNTVFASLGAYALFRAGGYLQTSAAKAIAKEGGVVKGMFSILLPGGKLTGIMFNSKRAAARIHNFSRRNPKTWYKLANYLNFWKNTDDWIVGRAKEIAKSEGAESVFRKVFLETNSTEAAQRALQQYARKMAAQEVADESSKMAIMAVSSFWGMRVTYDKYKEYGYDPLRVCEDQSKVCIDDDFLTDSVQMYIESVIISNIAVGAKSVWDFVKGMGMISAEAAALTRFVNELSYLRRGKEPSMRYAKAFFMYSSIAPFTVRPLYQVTSGMIRGLAGPGQVLYAVIASFLFENLWQLGYRSYVNEAMVNYLKNEEYGFLESLLLKMKADAFVLHKEDYLKVAQENPYNKRLFDELGITSFDTEVIEKLLHLIEYGYIHGGQKNVDEIIAQRIKLRDSLEAETYEQFLEIRLREHEVGKNIEY